MLTGVAFDVVGFDTGEGLPAPRDYRDHPDHPDHYRQADYPMQNRRALEARLPRRGHGKGWSSGEPGLDMPPLNASPFATSDTEISEMERKFEQTFAELISEEVRPSGHDDLRFEFQDDIGESSRPAPPARPLYSREPRPEPILGPGVRHEVEPKAKSSAEMPSRAKKPSSERAPWVSMRMILGSAIALAVGAGAGFIAAKRTSSSDVAATAAGPAGSAGLRLDYELKNRPAAAQHRKP